MQTAHCGTQACVVYLRDITTLDKFVFVQRVNLPWAVQYTIYCVINGRNWGPQAGQGTGVAAGGGVHPLGQSDFAFRHSSHQNKAHLVRSEFCLTFLDIAE